MLANPMAVNYTAAGQTAADCIVDHTVEYLAVARCPKNSFVAASSIAAVASWPSVASFRLLRQLDLRREELVPLGPTCSDRALPPHYTKHHSHHSLMKPVPWAKVCLLKPS